MGKQLTLCCFGFFLLTAVSQAGQITFVFDFSRLRVGTLHLDRGTEGWLVEGAYAGKGIAKVVNNAGLAPYLSTGQAFDTYCVDLLHDIYSGESPEVNLGTMHSWAQENIATKTSNPMPEYWPLASNPNAGRAAAFLYNNYVNDGLGTADKPDREAGLQLSIWEVLYEGSTDNLGKPLYQIGSGKIFFSNFSPAVTGYASGYLNGLSTHPGDLTGSDALWLQTVNSGQGLHSHYQDFIAPAVPEPKTIVLVGSGMALLAGIAFLRRQPRGK